jgi:hypothetical protein
VMLVQKLLAGMASSHECTRLITSWESMTVRLGVGPG